MRPKETLQCYWCGAPATSREHVPPDSLFPPGKRTNLITVPACAEHNQRFSQDDEKFRFYLQACSDSIDALDLFDKKTMRGLERPEAARLVADLFRGMQQIAVPGGVTALLQVDSTAQNRFFEKVTRGLHYHLFGRRIVGDVATFSPKFFNVSLDHKELASRLLRHLHSPQAIDGKVSHPEIFRFRYCSYRDGDREAFLVLMTFYNSVPVIGMCTNTEAVSQKLSLRL